MLQLEKLRSILYARTLLGVAVLTTMFANPTHAQEPPIQEPSGDDPASAETADEKEDQRATLDLGEFKINDLRPTRNMTAKLTFKLHLAFNKSLTKVQAEQLERWKHRLRDQIITAIRITHAQEFQEPDLRHFRKIILIRVNRLFATKLAEEVLLSEFLYRTH